MAKTSPHVQMPLRIPPKLHRRLLAEAARQGVSLNAYCVAMLERGK